MSPTTLRQHLDRLSLSQNGLARILAIDPRIVRRWATGDQEISERVERFITELQPDVAFRMLREAS